MNLKEIDDGIFIDPLEVVSLQKNGYWENGLCPSDNSDWIENGSVLVLKNGRKIYLKISSKEVMEKLKQ